MKLTYTEAITKLEKILAELENAAEVNFDTLNAKVKEAGALLEICKKHLHETDVELEKMLTQIAE